MCRQLKRLYSAGIINKDGDINEDEIFEFALLAFCRLVVAIRTGIYSTNQVKTFFKKCEKSDDWSKFYYLLCGYYIARNGTTSCIGWDIIHYQPAFHVYCYYFTEMLDTLDQY